MLCMSLEISNLRTPLSVYRFNLMNNGIEEAVYHD